MEAKPANNKNHFADYYPLSLQQKELLDRISVNQDYASTTDLLFVFHFSGKFNSPAFFKAMRDLISRHPILMMRVVSSYSGWMLEKLQTSIPEVIILFNSIEDCMAFAENGILTSKEIFDGSPLFRPYLGKMGETYILVMHCNHLIFDGWSYLVMCRDLSRLYNSASTNSSNLPYLPFQYADFVNTQNSLSIGTLDVARQYWVKRLKDYVGPKHLFSNSKSHMLGLCEEYYGYLPKEMENGLKKLASETRASTFSVLLCATAAAFCCLKGRRSVLVGSNYASRADPRFTNVIGYFTNTRLALVDLRENTSLTDLIISIREDWLYAADNFEEAYCSDILKSIDTPELLKINNLELPGLSGSRNIGPFDGQLNFVNTASTKISFPKKRTLLKSLELTWTKKNDKQVLWGLYQKPVTAAFIKDVLEISCKIINHPKAEILCLCSNQDHKKQV